MDSHVGQMMIVCFFVDFLLILGTDSLCGYPIEFSRSCVAALYGGVLGGMYLLYDIMPSVSLLYAAGSLVFVGLIAFGISIDAIRKCGIYILLHLALNGLAQNLSSQSFLTTILGALGLFTLCALGFRGKLGGRTYIPVELSYGKNVITVTALRDSGNDLRDPITGKPVLVIDVDTAEKLTGLSRQQLYRPLETMGMLPGLRLIPYKSVGGTGFLLALRLAEVKIGSWKGSSLVAFSPEVLNAEGIYQALTGGVA